MKSYRSTIAEIQAEIDRFKAEFESNNNDTTSPYGGTTTTTTPNTASYQQQQQHEISINEDFEPTPIVDMVAHGSPPPLPVLFEDAGFFQQTQQQPLAPQQQQPALTTENVALQTLIQSLRNIGALPQGMIPAGDIAATIYVPQQQQEQNRQDSLIFQFFNAIPQPQQQQVVPSSITAHSDLYFGTYAYKVAPQSSSSSSDFGQLSSITTDTDSTSSLLEPLHHNHYVSPRRNNEKTHKAKQSHLKKPSVKKPRKSKKKKSTRDPNAILPALSPYNFFFREQRERLLEHAKQICDDNTKSLYDIAMTECCEHGQDYYTEERKQKLLEKHWYRDRNQRRIHRKTHENIDFTKLSKIISYQWRYMSNIGREFYKNVANCDLQRYNQEILVHENHNNNNNKSTTTTTTANNEEDKEKEVSMDFNNNELDDNEV